MLDINFIRENTDLVKKNCLDRRVEVDIEELLRLDNERRDFIQQVEEFRAEKNKKSQTKPSKEEIVVMKEVGDKIKQYEERLTEIENEYKDLLLRVPNMSHSKAPVGSEKDFAILEEKGKPTKFNFEPKDHEELMVKLGMIDFERGAKVSGAKFYFFQNDAVFLNQALINYGLEILKSHGFNLYETPDLAKKDVVEASGFSPRGEESQIYDINGQDLSLIGTAEITMLGYHGMEILDLENGPVKCAALSHCFRTEAGSYGKANKGLYRVHQFTKLEMFIYCKPKESEQLLEEILSIEKEIVEGLELPYRVIDTPTGDLGGPAHRKFDIEAWMPFLNDYGEITSCSNCTDYQARRLNIRYKNKKGDSKLVHTLNGTAMVLSRFPLAIIENYQQEDGSVIVPKVLQKFMGKEKIN